MITHKHIRDHITERTGLWVEHVYGPLKRCSSRLMMLVMFMRRNNENVTDKVNKQHKKYNTTGDY